MFVKPTRHIATSISTESASYNPPSCHLLSLALAFVLWSPAWSDSTACIKVTGGFN